MTDVFLSYKAEDRSRITPLVRSLEQDGFSVWWDEHIGGGDDWRGTILRHLEAAKCVIVVWSRRSVGPVGEFVRDEASRAKKLGTYLPIRIDKVDPPLGFGETQALDLRNWKGDRSHPRYQALLNAAHARVGKETGGTAALTSRGVSRRAAIVGGAAATTALAAGGAWFFLRPTRAAAESIAVLPFANLSGDPSQAYFSDGISEELRSVLSRIPDLKVVARTSSEAVRDADAKAAAAKLHVRNILTGSVRRSADMIRISAQLVDGPSGTERWSDVYDRPFGDTLKIQTEIATMVAQALSIHLESTADRALREGGTQNAQAQDLLLNAQAIAWRKDDAESLRRALELVNRALAVDPRYADAISAKASITNYLGSFYASSAKDNRDKTAEAEKLARAAIAIAPESALAHAALAKTLWNDLRFRAGFAEFEKSGTLPNSTRSFFNGFDQYTVTLGCCRRFDAAVARADQLIAADPLNPNAFSTKGLVLAHQRRFAEGVVVMGQARALGPDLVWPRAFEAYFMMQAGKLPEAEKAFSEISGVGPWLSWVAVLAERQGRRAEADRILALMQREMGDAGYFQYAEVFAQQGRLDQAMDMLNKALVTRDPGLGFLQVDSMLDPLRSDGRFQALIKRLDFPT